MKKIKDILSIKVNAFEAFVIVLLMLATFIVLFIPMIMLFRLFGGLIATMICMALVGFYMASILYDDKK